MQKQKLQLEWWNDVMNQLWVVIVKWKGWVEEIWVKLQIEIEGQIENLRKTERCFEFGQR